MNSHTVSNRECWEFAKVVEQLAKGVVISSTIWEKIKSCAQQWETACDVYHSLRSTSKIRVVSLVNNTVEQNFLTVPEFKNRLHNGEFDTFEIVKDERGYHILPPLGHTIVRIRIVL